MNDIENITTRNFVRSLYRTVRCRNSKNGFEVFYIDSSKKKHCLGFSNVSRFDAWENAAKPFYKQMTDKLEKYVI